MDSYRLKKAERTEKGWIKHTVLIGGEESDFRFYSVRVGLVWPTVESPGYYILAGQEVWDNEIYPADRGVVRVLEEGEHKELSLTSLFDDVTSAYTSSLADSLYCDFKQEDFKLNLWDYLDQKNLRGVSVQDVPFRDIVLRLSLLADFNTSGDLAVDKGSPLYEDLKGISRSHLTDNPEVKFYRLNCLSYVISGFSKYPVTKPLVFKTRINLSGRHGHDGWML